MRVLHLGWGFYPWRPGGLIAYAEDLMDAQAERGHQVSYFFSGRHYPFVSGPRLKRWRRRDVAMYEVINAPILVGMEDGTRRPELEVSEPRMERAFERVLAQVGPDVVHIQELVGLPTSVIDIARAAGVPTAMTLQDYFPLCTTLRLFDSDGRVCMRQEIGADCVARNAAAPVDAEVVLLQTLRFEIARGRRALGLGPGERSLLERVLGRALRRAKGRGEHPADQEPITDDPATLGRQFQRRRELNVERLGRVDRLAAQSARVAEIYRTLGVPGDRLSTLAFSQRHLERLRPRALAATPSRLTFATLNGCASPSKGSEVVRGALRTLRAAGAEGEFRLLVFGYCDMDVREELSAFDGVELRGAYEREQLDALLDEVDVGIMPSVWEEAFGYTGVEMIAKGIPLIANPLGGIVEYAREGETAWLNPSCSGEGLAQLMLQLIREPERVLERGRSLREVREQVVPPWAPHVDAVESLYDEIVQPA